MFKINQICFDSENKEFVKITNGKTSGFLTSETFTPTEAIALRVISINRGKPVIAFTYRKVNPRFLTPQANNDGRLNAFFKTEKPVYFEFIGRV